MHADGEAASGVNIDVDAVFDQIEIAGHEFVDGAVEDDVFAEL